MYIFRVFLICSDFRTFTYSYIYIYMLIEHWSLIQISRLLLMEWLPGWVSLSSTAQHRSRESKQRARTVYRAASPDSRIEPASPSS